MLKRALFVLSLLPGLTHAAICKTVGEDGVVSFTNDPTIDCPEGARVPDFSRPAPEAEQANRVEGGVTGRQLTFEPYRAMTVVSPADGSAVRDNAGKVLVSIQLEPGLQQNHLVVVYLDGRAVPVNFAGTAMELLGVNRGSHTLRAQVRDAGGRMLIESPLVRFTLQQVNVEISVDPVTGDDFLDANEAADKVTITGTYSGANRENAAITLRFPVSEWISPTVKVNPKDGTWKVEVRGELLAREPSFEARAQVGPAAFTTTSTHSVAADVFKRYTASTPPEGPDYTPSKDGIPSTPGRNNPAFTPPVGGILTTPGKTNPAYTP